jgi:hypothetical protein
MEKAQGIKIGSKPNFKQSLGFSLFQPLKLQGIFELHKSTMFVAAHFLVITK